MDQMTDRQLATHINVLGWVYIFGNALFLFLGGFLWVLLVSIGAISADPDALRILTIIGTLLGVFLIAFGLPGIVAGIGLLRRRMWGRVLALVVGFLGLVNIPIGTLIGLYAFWVLLQDQASDYFFSSKEA